MVSIFMDILCVQRQMPGQLDSASEYDSASAWRACADNFLIIVLTEVLNLIG